LRLGPLTLAQCRSFLPDGDAFRPLRELVRFAVGPEYDFDIQLVVYKEEAPPLRLGGEPKEANRLGWTSWIKTMPLDHDPSDVVVSCDYEYRPRVRESNRSRSHEE
jgi:type VI secretion system protein ImpH